MLSFYQENPNQEPLIKFMFKLPLRWLGMISFCKLNNLVKVLRPPFALILDETIKTITFPFPRNFHGIAWPISTNQKQRQPNGLSQIRCFLGCKFTHPYTSIFLVDGCLHPTSDLRQKTKENAVNKEYKSD